MWNQRSFDIRPFLWTSEYPLGASILSFAGDDKLRPGEDVTSTSQYQVFVEKFDQEPKKVRIKMADLTGP